MTNAAADITVVSSLKLPPPFQRIKACPMAGFFLLTITSVTPLG